MSADTLDVKPLTVRTPSPVSDAAPAEMYAGDLETARLYGKRVADTATKLRG